MQTGQQEFMQVECKRCLHWSTSSMDRICSRCRED